MDQIIIEPFLSLLSKAFRTHRFFVNKSVPEVVTEVLQEHDIKGWEYEFTLKAEYPKREQINQYPNDFVFLSDTRQRRHHEAAGMIMMKKGLCWSFQTRLNANPEAGNDHS